MFTSRQKPFFFFTVIPLIVFFSCFSFAYGASLEDHKLSRAIARDYYVLLFTRIVVPNTQVAVIVTEIVEITFSDNGTFALTSDSWDEPAIGAYEKKPLLITAKGETGIFYDQDFEELMEIKYSFTGLPFRGFFICGMGVRKLKFLKGENTLLQNFFFMGRGI